MRGGDEHAPSSMAADILTSIVRMLVERICHPLPTSRGLVNRMRMLESDH